MNPAIRIERGLIRAYRSLHEGHLSPCRFTPSCSQYALDALETYGFFKANRLISGRLLRCRPWGGSGFDPVPLASSPEQPAAEAAVLGSPGRLRPSAEPPKRMAG